MNLRRTFTVTAFTVLLTTTSGQSTCPAGAFAHNISGLQCENMQANAATFRKEYCDW